MVFAFLTCIIVQAAIIENSSANICLPELLRWLPEEDDRLKFALNLQQQSVNPNWKDVSIAVGTKTATQCSRRWKRALQPDLKKGRWSREEDEALKTLVQEVNFQWREIARLMPGRSSKQCRERWKKLTIDFIYKK